MGECKEVTTKELLKGNKRYCLSPLRVFGKCDECPVMRDYYADQRLKKPLGRKPCESMIVNKERQKILQKRFKIEKQIKELNEKLKKIK